MKVALFAGLVSLAANLLILSAFIPFSIGFQAIIILQIAFWTFFASIGATATMIILKKLTAHPTHAFIVLAFLVFFLSLIPIYLHAGILHDFPPSLLMTAVNTISAMHIADSLIISGFVIRLRWHPTAAHKNQLLPY